MFNSSKKKVIPSNIAFLVNAALSMLNRFLIGRLDDKPEALEWLLAVGALPNTVVNILSDDILEDAKQLRALANDLIKDSPLQKLLFSRADFLADKIAERGDHKALALSEIVRWAKEVLQEAGIVLTDVNPSNRNQLIDVLQLKLVDDNMINAWVALTTMILPGEESRPIILSTLALLASQLETLEVNENPVGSPLVKQKLAVQSQLNKLDDMGDPIFNTKVVNADLSVVGLPDRRMEVNPAFTNKVGGQL